MPSLCIHIIDSKGHAAWRYPQNSLLRNISSWTRLYWGLSHWQWRFCSRSTEAVICEISEQIKWRIYNRQPMTISSSASLTRVQSEERQIYDNMWVNLGKSLFLTYYIIFYPPTWIPSMCIHNSDSTVFHRVEFTIYEWRTKDQLEDTLLRQILKSLTQE